MAREHNRTADHLENIALIEQDNIEREQDCVGSFSGNLLAMSDGGFKSGHGSAPIGKAVAELGKHAESGHRHDDGEYRSIQHLRDFFHTPSFT